jgi:hypothetical protein
MGLALGLYVQQVLLRAACARVHEHTLGLAMGLKLSEPADLAADGVRRRRLQLMLCMGV